jgi:hypothetical protein
MGHGLPDSPGFENFIEKVVIWYENKTYFDEGTENDALVVCPAERGKERLVSVCGGEVRGMAARTYTVWLLFSQVSSLVSPSFIVLFEFIIPLDWNHSHSRCAQF